MPTAGSARDIVAGQFAGLAALFLVSAAGSLLSLVIHPTYLGLLGILPIVIGLRKLSNLRHDPSAPESRSQGSIAAVALVTIANGGDNIGIYMPAFAIHSGGQIGVIAMVFAAMTALWCMLAYWMVNHRRFGAPPRRYGHIFAPVMLIGLGVLILHQAGTIGWLLHPANH